VLNPKEQKNKVKRFENAKLHQVMFDLIRASLLFQKAKN